MRDREAGGYIVVQGARRPGRSGAGEPHVRPAGLGRPPPTSGRARAVAGRGRGHRRLAADHRRPDPHRARSPRPGTGAGMRSAPRTSSPPPPRSRTLPWRWPGHLGHVRRHRPRQRACLRRRRAGRRRHRRPAGWVPLSHGRDCPSRLTFRRPSMSTGTPGTDRPAPRHRLRPRGRRPGLPLRGHVHPRAGPVRRRRRPVRARAGLPGPGLRAGPGRPVRPGPAPAAAQAAGKPPRPCPSCSSSASTTPAAPRWPPPCSSTSSAGRVHVRSAGSAPAGEINPTVVPGPGRARHRAEPGVTRSR